ncbi:integrator complex subunit 4 [Daktulosphaira vitifoliae]|uniref:integrator complex subunit 4 n=1 Tax=Daktulosphaira vitifoliae TaxID=58002 RepID=UPI0021A9FF55|nr:integrator complex subunit 4 [Daktulosphaira vitifoliae]XP_050525129.1 integrator complex subunit 4 [Daktulosphaira vitifoliae]
MAALLKKRALAEYSTQVLEQQPPVKKLKCLVKLSTQPTCTTLSLVNSIIGRKTSNEVIQILLEVLEMPQFQNADVTNIIIKLSDHFKLQLNSTVRILIFSIFSVIGSSNETSEENVYKIIDIIMSLMEDIKSQKTKTSGLKTLLVLGKRMKHDLALHLKLTNYAKNNLKDYRPNITCQSLGVIGELMPVEIPEESSKIHSEMLLLIESYTQHYNAKTRSNAFNTMVRLHDRGIRLNPTVYLEVCSIINDDNDMVREAALNVISVLGTYYPEERIKGINGEEMARMCDEAFENICNFMTDISYRIRTQAARLLGKFLSVSSSILLKTLDQTLMSNLRRKRTSIERVWECLAKGTAMISALSTKDTPQEMLDAQQVSLVSTGASGAFLHGLEDEYLEVRIATISSMCSLATHHSEFAVVAMEFLVDMFNDEIEEVRLIAIESLVKLSYASGLRDDQVEIILAVIEDSSSVVREGLHNIFASFELLNQEGLLMCVNKLIDSLKKYPEDKKSIWNCMQNLGLRHSILTLALVPELLAIHPMFETPEPNVEEPSYVSILIMVFNAASKCNAIVSLLEDKTIKHYSYLRDIMPHLVPSLQLGGRSSIGQVDIRTTEVDSSKSLELIESLLKQVSTVSGSTKVKITMLETYYHNLIRLAQLDQSVNGTAELSALYIHSQLLLNTVLNNNNKTFYSNAVSTHQANNVRTNISQLLQNTLKMQYLFVGLSMQELASIKQFKLKVIALLLVYIVKATNQSARALCHYFLTQLEDTNKYISENNLPLESFTSIVFKELSQLEESKPGIVAKLLLPILQNSELTPPPKPNTKIKMCKVIIIRPLGGPDTTHKLSAGLILPISLNAELYSLQNDSSSLLRLKIKYPDQQTHLIMPRKNHLRLVNLSNESYYLLDTNALISHRSEWSEACFVELSLAFDLTETEGALAHVLPPTQPCIVDLCKPVKLKVHPKPVRRGI